MVLSYCHAWSSLSPAVYSFHDDHVASYNIASHNQPPFPVHGLHAQVSLKHKLFTGKKAMLGQTKNDYGQLAVLHSYFAMETS